MQCQNDLSQHKNKDKCMKQLKTRLYEIEMMKKNTDKQAMEESKSDIGRGRKSSYAFWTTAVQRFPHRR